jgi:hypothetical protein
MERPHQEEDAMQNLTAAMLLAAATFVSLSSAGSHETTDPRPTVATASAAAHGAPTSP